MKYKERDFSQLYNKAIKILNTHNKKIPYSARWLYVHLNFLEHRFTGKKEDFFFRSIKDLTSDTGISMRAIIEAIKTLKKLNLIQTWQMPWLDEETGKKTERHITAFRILRP